MIYIFLKYILFIIILLFNSVSWGLVIQVLPLHCPSLSQRPLPSLGDRPRTCQLAVYSRRITQNRRFKRPYYQMLLDKCPTEHAKVGLHVSRFIT